MSEIEKQGRLYFIDKLRTFLIVLVIFHHALITYGGMGGWYFVDPGADENILFIIFGALDQAFFMGLLFLISSYFTPGSFSRHGAKKYISQRLLRFGIPLLVYMLIISPVMVYLLNIQRLARIGFITYYLNQFTSLEKIYQLLSSTGPLWFIVLLLFFTFAYSLYRVMFKSKSDKNTEKKPPGTLFLILMIFVMAIPTFILRLWFPLDKGIAYLNIQPAFISQYVVMLILGIIAYKRDWFRKITTKQGIGWMIVSILSLFYFAGISAAAGVFEGDFTKIMGGFYWQAFAYDIWESTWCIGMMVSLIVLFRQKFNANKAFSKMLAKNSYTVYLIHAPVLVSVSVLFALLTIPGFLKFFIVFPLATALCFLISHLVLRRIPGASKIL